MYSLAFNINRLGNTGRNAHFKLSGVPTAWQAHSSTDLSGPSFRMYLNSAVSLKLLPRRHFLSVATKQAGPTARATAAKFMQLTKCLFFPFTFFFFGFSVYSSLLVFYRSKRLLQQQRASSSFCLAKNSASSESIAQLFLPIHTNPHTCVC